jgi:hypothetical protein
MHSYMDVRTIFTRVSDSFVSELVSWQVTAELKTEAMEYFKMTANERWGHFHNKLFQSLSLQF